MDNWAETTSLPLLCLLAAAVYQTARQKPLSGVSDTTASVDTNVQIAGKIRLQSWGAANRLQQPSSTSSEIRR